MLSCVSNFVTVFNFWDGSTHAMTGDDLQPKSIGTQFMQSKIVPVILENSEFPSIQLPTDATDLYSAQLSPGR